MNIEIKKSLKRRSLSIQIYPDTRVVVSAPFFYPDFKIQQFIREKSSWIQKKVEDFQKRQPKKILSELKEGVNLLLFGENVILNIFRSSSLTRSSQSQVELHQGHLNLMIPEKLSSQAEQTLIKKLLMQWYRSQALAKTQARVSVYAEPLGVVAKSIQIKNYRTRWGTCKSTGEITFNWRLAMVPEWVLDYVVVHELAHLRVMSHQPAFWRWVEKVYPEHKKARLWLRKLSFE